MPVKDDALALDLYIKSAIGNNGIIISLASRILKDPF